MATRYVYTCRRIEQVRRNVAHAHQHEVVELNPTEPLGGIAQNAVELDEEGLRAYQVASNLLEIQEMVPAHVQGELVEEVETPEHMMSAAGVTRIPADEDARYLKSLFFRNTNMYQGKGVKVAVLGTAIGAHVAAWLKPQVAAARSFVEGNPLAETHDHGSHVAC